jgi:hypothetical protein
MSLHETTAYFYTLTRLYAREHFIEFIPVTLLGLRTAVARRYEATRAGLLSQEFIPVTLLGLRTAVARRILIRLRYFTIPNPAVT